MNKAILYTTDENTSTRIREASLEEILDATRLGLSQRVRRGIGFTSPRVTDDYLRVRPHHRRRRYDELCGDRAHLAGSSPLCESRCR